MFKSLSFIFFNFSFPSFENILNQVSEFYKKNRDKIILQASQIKDVFKKDQKKSSVIGQNLNPHLEAMLNYIDFEWGGFKGSPKFPQFYVFESFFHSSLLKTSATKIKVLIQ